MKKPHREEPEQPLLFDFPLQDAPAPSPRRPAAKPTPPPAAAQPSAPAPAVDQPPLFDALAPSLRRFDDPANESVPQELVVVDGAVGIIDRWLAGVADLLIHALIVAATVLAVARMGLPLTLGDWPAFAGLGLLLSCLYCVIGLAFWGQTPGMYWLGHLARSVTDEPLTFGQTFLRWLGALLTLALAGLPLLLVWAGGRSMSDRLSDSKTLRSTREDAS
jgi:uncharacterized RDD family membrane protein YckC